MTVTLDVRDLWVLFRGASESVVGYSTFIFGAPEPMHVPADHRIGMPAVSFTVASGDCLAVLGASGSGKSSLLRTLAGLQPVTQGSIIVNDRDVTALPPERRSVVYLHQEPVLFPHLSVLDNVAFPMTIRGMAVHDAHRRAFDMLFRLQVAELNGNRPDALSGGQRHRVALARALCAEPAVMLLDEPLSSLDPAVRRDVREALLAVRAASGAAMVLVTHDLDDAMSVATHVATIDRFRQLSEPVAPAALLHAPPTLDAARLLGVYAELRGTVSTGASPVFTWVGGQLPAPGHQAGAAVACVRSHELALHGADTHAGAPDAPVLTVTRRRDTAHEVLLDLRDAADAQETVRVSGSTAAQPGDRVQVAIRHARLFPTHDSPDA